jgi:hypothetical protein
MPSGEERIWDTLATLDPDEVCRRTDASYDAASGLYALKSFGRDFQISLREKKIFCQSPDSEVFLLKLGYFFRLSVTGYLAIARDVVPTGRLLNPVNMKSGQLFFMGSHILPLDRVAEKYAGDRDGFLKRGEELGGERIEYGDASLRLFPLPRVPVVQILWLADDEFPARADLLFDSSCEVQLPIDVVWAIAMLSVLAMF